MKKLKLDLQSLNAEVLTRSQLKQILGGDGSSGGGSGSSCSVTCDPGFFACCCSGDCKCHSETDNQTVYDCIGGGHGSSSCSA